MPEVGHPSSPPSSRRSKRLCNTSRYRCGRHVPGDVIVERDAAPERDQRVTARQHDFDVCRCWHDRHLRDGFAGFPRWQHFRLFQRGDLLHLHRYVHCLSVLCQSVLFCQTGTVTACLLLASVSSSARPVRSLPVCSLPVCPLLPDVHTLLTNQSNFESLNPTQSDGKGR